MSARRLGAVLLAGAVLGSGILALETGYFETTRAGRLSPPLQDRAKEFAVSLNNGSVPDETDFRAAIMAKPLFVQGRGMVAAAPPKAAAPPVAPPVEPEAEIRLMGVQLSEHDKLAILQLSNAPRAVRAREGQPIQSWTLQRIYPDHVVLTRSSRTRSIYLGDVKRPPDDNSATVSTD